MVMLLYICGGNILAAIYTYIFKRLAKVFQKSF